MVKPRADTIPTKLAEAEQDLVSHLENGYQLEGDSLGGNPALGRLKDDEVVLPTSANSNTIKALEDRGLIVQGKSHDPLTIAWRLKSGKRGGK